MSTRKDDFSHFSVGFLRKFVRRKKKEMEFGTFKVKAESRKRSWPDVIGLSPFRVIKYYEA